MKACVFIYIVFFLLPVTNCIIVATYNIWNTMFNWNVRKWNIRRMIRNNAIDVIAFQEVRSNGNKEEDNQLLEVKKLLPNQFRYIVYKGATKVNFIKGSIDKYYSEEGIGLVSRLPIVSSSSQYLIPHPRDPDKNTRVLLHVVIKDNEGKLWNVLTLHLSYYRQQQCRNIAEVINYINKRKLQNVIVLGDLNTYNDYEGPMKILEKGTVESSNECWEVLHGGAGLPTLSHTFTDVWKHVHPMEPGLTFSNMPTPGLESRPDRIYIPSGEQVRKVHTDGSGGQYRHLYSRTIFWERLKTIVSSSQLTEQGVTGYPCVHDCGPHGSCVCGVCAALGNKKNCLLPDCDLCQSSLSTNLHILLFLTAVVGFHFFFAILQTVIVAAASYTGVSGQMYSFLGLNCCLVNPQLWGKSMRAHQRKFKILRLCRYWPLFNLPPYVQVLISVIAAIVLYASFRSVFADVLELTFNVLDEEYFPSDHLMMIADIG